MLAALLIFLATIVLVIWQPRGLGIGWSATLGAVVALLSGVVHLGDIPVVWQIVWNATAAFGACQGSCRLIYAAKGCLRSAFMWSATTESRSGLRVTAPIGDQSRVVPDQRAGLRSRALRYSSCRAARMA